MIHFLLTRVGSHTIEDYLAEPRVGAPAMKVLCYEDLDAGASLEPGVYVFADFERLPPALLETALRLRGELARAPGVVCVNDPARWSDRVAFLQGLYREGINDFDVHLADESVVPNRFPVFIRHRWDHTGAHSPLLYTAEELRERLAALDGLDELVVTEFSDTADSEGIYRKYAAFRVGDRVIPRHLFFSRNWLQKVSELTDPHLLEEEMRYLADNPHAELVRSLFDRSGVEWGRIDYGFADDAIRVWEINTNPTIVPVGDWGPRTDAQLLFLDRFHAALRALDPNRVQSGHGDRRPT